MAAPMLGKGLARRYLAVVGSAVKYQAVMSLGADAAINDRKQDIVAEVTRLTAGRDANLIIDLIAGDYRERNM